jgi:glutamate carboxypeptidase
MHLRRGNQPSALAPTFTAVPYSALAAMAEAPLRASMTALLHDLRKRRPAMLRLLARFVRAESPSDNKPAVDHFARMVAWEWRKRAAQVRFVPRRQSGDHLLVRLPARQRRARRILLLGHLDTVYELGTLERMPFRIAGGRAWGPGSFDMKGGLVLALAAVDALAACGVEPESEIACLWTADEEVGSGTSRQLIEHEARGSDAVLVLEPSGEPHGALKTSRKGVGELEIRVTGRAAHSGLNPDQGINAIEELARQMARFKQWDNRRTGTRVNVNVISGGTRGNVIAAQARALVDLRASSRSEMARLEKRFRALRPSSPGARLEIRGGFSRPPMERRTSAGLFAAARALAAPLGGQLTEMAAGGGSDGNFTAALGVPTLDGLGAVGAGAHSLGEHIVIRELAPRAALIAGLLATL